MYPTGSVRWWDLLFVPKGAKSISLNPTANEIDKSIEAITGRLI